MKKNISVKSILLAALCFLVVSVSAQPHRHRKARKHAPHHRYSKLPHWGYHYKVPPRGAYIIPHTGIRYHYHSGVFYKPKGRKYVVVRPPVGVRVRKLPPGYIHFMLNDRRFFYYYGTFYVKSIDNGEYITVLPPEGALVDALPDGYKKVIIDGETYYEFEGTYYSAFIDESGEVWYEVVGIN